MGHRDVDKYIEESRDRQRNIVFPDTVRNARAVDVFLWRRSPNPTVVQRIGAWLFGSTWVGGGLALGMLASKAYSRDRDLLAFGAIAVIALFFFAVGIRIFRNGFPRSTRPHTD
jgi:hypothetical protein